MADPRNHLEKMGRELKCPICLSLLNSAVSLSCNHVFCNSCIVKSMKSDSNCPVCKLPYRRREIRPAPHMDNLVCVYKSMEVASGLNIFVTQSEPLAEPSEIGDRQFEADRFNSDDQVLGAAGQNSADNHRKTNRKRPRTTKSSTQVLDPVPGKPSFPTKKRVHVAHYPLPETPVQPAKVEGRVTSTLDKLQDHSGLLKDKPVLSEQGLVRSPFFWLREDEDVEKSSQQSDADIYTTPPNIPTFSDIKDSDDRNSHQLSPEVEMHGKLDGLDLFDSEMFEWTQRPCSPELHSSPLTMQVEDTYELAQEKSEAALQKANENKEHCIENDICMTLECGIVDKVQLEVSSSIKNTTKQTVNGTSNKRGRKVKKGGRKKRAKNDTNKEHGFPINQKEESNLVQNQISDTNDLVVRSKKVGTSVCINEPVAENAVPDRALLVDISVRSKASQLPASFKRKTDENFKLKNDKLCRKISSEKKEGTNLRSKSRKISSTEVHMPGKVVSVQCQTDEEMNGQPLGSAVCMDNAKDTSATKENHSKGSTENISVFSCKRDKPECTVSKKVSFKSIFAANQSDNVSFKETQSIGKSQGSTSLLEGENISRRMKRHKTVVGVSDKNESLSDKIQCAFCHSSEDSEVSGEMLHYSNGRSVAADDRGGSKVIHSHRSCTEWAPNVYFVEDTVFNLEVELARSRRIKCCCCGLKGAALGCYEKTCCRSFHVPCAKLTLQCRWDTDNFVMLCPNHASTKLPNEIPKPQSQERKKKSIPKVSLQACCNKVASDKGTSSWNLSKDKLVLCCSSLTAEEKDIISEFQRSSKVAVLTKWDSRVTHVIASTDENGACKRTLKVLMGILEGKWILNMEWVKASMKAMKPLNEEPYEIVMDSNGIKDGPRLGRLRVLNKQPKLFNGLNFYLMGGFSPSYKGYLQDLVTAAGGSILHRKPISTDHGALSDSSTLSTFIIYSLDPPDKSDISKQKKIFDGRKSDAVVLAKATGATAVSNSWVLNSIASCKLLNHAE